MDSCIKNLMKIPIDWEKYSNQNGAGEKSYSSKVTLYCYKQGGARLVRTSRGEQVVSKEILYLDGSNINVAQISVKDRITTPTGTYPILDVLPFYNEKGILDLVEVII